MSCQYPDNGNIFSNLPNKPIAEECFEILFKKKAPGEKGAFFNLYSGNYIFIPAQKKHRVTWTDPEETCVVSSSY